MRTNNWYHKKVEDYLEKYYKNPKTRKTIRAYLKFFFNTINKEPTKWLNQSTKSIQDDLWAFAKKIENNPNKTQKLSLGIIK
jgi:hypothetical protein